MRITTLVKSVSVAAIVCVCSAVLAEMSSHPTTPSALDRFKALAGTWEGTVTHGDEPQPATVTYAVTAGGSAVAETLFPGTEHEMLTVFYIDDGKLTLTHYCMLGNQPRMQAAAASDVDDKVAFTFAGGANIADPEKDMHMHEASYTFTDADHLRTTWTMYQQGEPMHEAVIELKRKKD